MRVFLMWWNGAPCKGGGKEKRGDNPAPYEYTEQNFRR